MPAAWPAELATPVKATVAVLPTAPASSVTATLVATGILPDNGSATSSSVKDAAISLAFAPKVVNNVASGAAFDGATTRVKGI